ncbi:MAG: glycine cleavage system protein GcvH [Candidatus Margulisiibacteriota bacterium]|jgi:glycine cleavage system H protein
MKKSNKDLDDKMGEDFPADLRYSKEHEWVKIEGDKAIVGITDHAQSEMGDIVFVELPELGRDIEQGAELGVVESVKTVSTVYAPISGEVITVNTDLDDSPEIINSSPYEDGWMVKLAMSDINEVDDLMTAAEYMEYIVEDDEE